MSTTHQNNVRTEVGRATRQAIQVAHRLEVALEDIAEALDILDAESIAAVEAGVVNDAEAFDDAHDAIGRAVFQLGQLEPSTVKVAAAKLQQAIAVDRSVLEFAAQRREALEALDA